MAEKTDGLSEQVVMALNVKLFHNVLAVVVDRSHATAQLVSDFLVRQALCNQTHNFNFSSGQGSKFSGGTFVTSGTGHCYVERLRTNVVSTLMHFGKTIQ